MKTEGHASLSTHDKRSTILFIGDTTSFSEMYIRLIQSEFMDLNIQRVVRFADARRGAKDVHGAVRAIVIACSSGVQTMNQLHSLLRSGSDALPVLAYQTKAEARTALEAIEDRTFVAQLSFLPLRARIDCTVTILRLVLSGERHVSGEVLDLLMAWKSKKMADTGDAMALTAREREVLQHLAKGASNKGIARELDLAESTVKLHIHHIISKLGVRNRTEAAVAYVAGQSQMQTDP